MVEERGGDARNARLRRRLAAGNCECERVGYGDVSDIEPGGGREHHQGDLWGQQRVCAIRVSSPYSYDRCAHQHRNHADGFTESWRGGTDHHTDRDGSASSYGLNARQHYVL